MNRSRNLLSLVFAVAVAAMMACAIDPSADAVAASATGEGDAGADASTSSTVSTIASVPAFMSGMTPMPNDQPTPNAWLPPGAFHPDTGPSDVIYPAQKITVRFNHKYHIEKQGLQCKTCHSGATTSDSVKDSLTPKPQVCDSCHLTDHTNIAKVEAGDEGSGQCAFCHVGYKNGDGNTVLRMELPRANMVFNHKKHADKNIACGQCHGSVEKLELATRDQLPRMKGCFSCHAMSDSAARGTAKGACDNCHVAAGTENGGVIRTMFPSGVLKPPRWLRNSAHTPDFIERHKLVAGNDSQFCSNCHKEDFCVGCHDGRVRPRSVHPSDYISMHPVEARLAMQKCTSCHREQTFCVSCHQRAGVSMSGPTDVRNNGRFHPPKEQWSDAPRKPGHHAFEAQRNLNACVSCHIERDCVTCHGGNGIGGGFNPHRAGFAASCGTQMRRNPRPCFTCHLPDDGVLAQCR